VTSMGSSAKHEKTLRRQRRRADAQAKSRAGRTNVVGHNVVAGWLKHIRPEMLVFRRELDERSAAVISGSRRTAVGKEAWVAIEMVHAAALTVLVDIANQASPAEWLFHLRRSRAEFEQINDLKSTAPYAQAIAEAICSGSINTVSHPKMAGSVTYYEPRGEMYLALAELVQGAALLYELQGRARWAGKGAPVEIGGGQLPMPLPSMDLRQAVELYDERHERGALDLLSRVALHYGDVDLSRINEQTVPVLVVGETLSSSRPFIPTIVDLRQVDPLTDERTDTDFIWKPELLDLLILDAAVFYSPFFQEGLSNLRDPAMNRLNPMTQYGYRLVLNEARDWEIDRAIEIINESRLGGLLPAGVNMPDRQTVIDRLLSLRSQIWTPRLGSPLIPVNDSATMIDMVALSRRLISLLERPAVSGSQTNIWSEAFEREVQRSIDRTNWRPSNRLPARGHALRIGGKAVTDVDAWAERDGVVVAVSCKALPFSEDYDRGTYSAVRNVRLKTEQAVRDWKEKVGRLDESRLGDNFDLRWATRVVPVVVQPFAPFVLIGDETADVLPRLPAVVSSSELTAWLGGEPDSPYSVISGR